MIQQVIVFGDIHGCYKAAETAIKQAEELKIPAIFLGDYVDRGPDSIKTLEYLLHAKKNHSDWVFLRGNHDQMLLDLILGITEPNCEFSVPNGLTSNEATTKVFLNWQSAPAALRNEMLKFLESTFFYFETEYWIFVHTPLKDNCIPVNEKSEEELLWNYETTPVWTSKSFIHGHSTVESISKKGKGININTCCGYGGFLTGIVVDATSDKIFDTYLIKENGECLI